MMANGTASYANANGPAGDTSGCMNLATYNAIGAGVIQDGDIIRMSSQGGDYTSQLNVRDLLGASATLTNVDGEASLPTMDVGGTDACISNTRTGWTFSNIILDGRLLL